MGLAVLIFFVAIAAYLVGIVVTLLKGNTERFKDGFLFSPIWVASAFRLAEPDSWWARHFYDDLQIERARVRSEFRHRPNDPALAPGGPSYGFEPESLDELPEGSYRCTLCGRVLPSEQDALRHADSIHTEVPFADAKAALVEVGDSAVEDAVAQPQTD